MLLCTIYLLTFLIYCEGRSSNIINGKDVNPVGKYPWQVSLQNKYSNWHFCGGSILSRTWILSAAHCVPDGQASSRQVVVGMHDQNRRYGKPVTHYVKRIIVHASYTHGKHWEGADIALLELETPIEYNSLAQPITIDTRGNYVDMQGCVLSGWGSMGSDGSAVPAPATSHDSEKGLLMISDSMTRGIDMRSSSAHLSMNPGASVNRIADMVLAIPIYYRKQQQGCCHTHNVNNTHGQWRLSSVHILDKMALALEILVDQFLVKIKECGKLLVWHPTY